MATNKSVRSSNIEVLRIVLILGVILLHYFNPQIGGGIKYAERESINFFILYIFESAAICAVDLFYMISGYFLIRTNKRSIRKPLELIIQVILYKEIVYIFMVVFLHKKLSIYSFVERLLPSNYFVIFYCILFFISPYINKLLDTISRANTKRLVIILFLIFSVYCTGVQLLINNLGKQLNGLDSVGMYGSQNGYTIVNFTLMYIIGACIGKYKLNIVFNNKKKLTLAYLGCMISLFVWAIIESNDSIKLSSTAYIYCNPLVIMEAAVLLLLFLNIDIGSNKVINKCSAGVFSVFLLHGYLLGYLGIKKYVKGNALIMVAHMLISSVILFVICTLCHYCYKTVTTPIFNKIFGSHDPEIINLESNNETTAT